MIDKVVSSIIEAEEQAKRMIENAERKAAETLSEAEITIAASNKKAAEDNKAYAFIQLHDAEEQANKDSAAHFEGKKKEIQAEVRAHNANLDKAINTIMEKIK